MMVNIQAYLPSLLHCNPDSTVIEPALLKSVFQASSSPYKINQSIFTIKVYKTYNIRRIIYEQRTSALLIIAILHSKTLSDISTKKKYMVKFKRLCVTC